MTRINTSNVAIAAILVLASMPSMALSSDETTPTFASVTQAHEDKMADGYEDWLQYELPGGLLRVIVATHERTAAGDDSVAAGTVEHAWFPGLPHYMALVTPGQLEDILADANVARVTPDHPLSYFTPDSTVNTNTRSIDGQGTGVWYFDSPYPTGSGGAPSGANQFPGSLASDHSGFTGAVTGDGVTVAVVDSGVDETNADFSGWSCSAGPYMPCDSRISENVKAEMLVGTNFGFGNNLPTTDIVSGHGTHVAGTIAGNAYVGRDGYNLATNGGDGLVFGVAPESELVMVSNGDVLWAGLASWSFAHIYDEMVFRNSPNYEDVKVISNSWGCLGGCSYNQFDTVMAYSKLFYQQDVVVVFAAGNDGCGNTLSGYAANPYVLGVASYNDHSNNPSGFSSCGTTNTLPTAGSWDADDEFAGLYGGGNHLRRPDVTAPGESIVAAKSLTGGAASGIPRANTWDATGTAAGINYYATMSGTSMATPHVAGVAALLFDACPAASSLEVMRAIIASAGQPGSISSAPAKQVGYGTLDAAAALTWLDSQISCTGP